MAQVILARGANLSLEELQTLSDATEGAESRARRLAAVVDGVAGLICKDSRQAPVEGFLQSERSGLIDLLWVVSDELGTIASMIDVGSEAQYEADKRRGLKS